MKCKPLHIIRAKNITLETFKNDYLNGNKPVIITDYIANWPAMQWNLQNLKEKAGHNDVFVRRKTASDSYKSGLKYNIESMKFGEYIQDLEENDAKSYNSYLAVQNIKKALPELEVDIEIPCYVQKLHGGPFLWLAQAGHYEFCHFDPDDNILIVFSGEKVVKLYPPTELDKMYPNALGSKGKTIQSSVNCCEPNLGKYPNFEDAIWYESTIQPGEMLFFPAFWWHQVTSTKQTISMNIFFGNKGENVYLTRIMNTSGGDQWNSFKYWLLNIVTQNQEKEQFQAVLCHLEESLTNFLLKQWKEIPSAEQLQLLVRTVLDHCNLCKIPFTENKKRHAPPLKIRGLLWR